MDFRLINNIYTLNVPFDSIGQEYVFSTNTPLRGWCSLAFIRLGTVGETANRTLEFQYRYSINGIHFTDWLDLPIGHEYLTIGAAANGNLDQFKNLSGWDTKTNPTLYWGNTVGASTNLHAFLTPADRTAGVSDVGELAWNIPTPQPVPVPVGVLGDLSGDIDVLVNDLGLSPFGTFLFETTYNELVEIPIINDFIVEVKVVRTGTDPSGTIGLKRIELNGTFSQEYFDHLSFENTVFSDISWDNTRWNEIWLNLLRKWYFDGIVPKYITRNETDNDEVNDEDYIAYWKTVAYFYAAMAEIGIRKIEEIREDIDDLGDYLRQRSGLVCEDTPLEVLQYWQEYFADEMRQRGTHMVHLKQGFGEVLNAKWADEIFLTEYIHYGYENQMIEISNFTDRDIVLEGYELQRDNADNIFAISYDLTPFGKLKRGESLVISRVYVPQADAIESGVGSIVALDGTTQIRLVKNGNVIDHLGDYTVAGWGLNMKFFRNSDVDEPNPTVVDPNTVPFEWAAIPLTPPAGVTDSNDITFGSLGNHTVSYGLVLEEGKPVDGELLRYICYEEFCDEFLFEYLPRHLSGWNLNNTSPIYLGVTGRNQLNKAPENTQDIQDLEHYCLIEPSQVSLVENDGLVFLLTEAGENLTTEVGPTENLLAVFDQERDVILIEPPVGTEAGVCFKACVHPSMAYEVTFWCRFESINSTDLSVRFEAFKNELAQEFATISTNATVVEAYPVQNVGRPNNQIYYFIRCIVHAFDEPQRFDNFTTNWGVGENVRWIGVDVNNIKVSILNQGVRPFYIWDIKMLPVELNNNSTYLNSYNVCNNVLINRNESKLNEDLANDILFYLLPYGTVYQPQFLADEPRKLLNFLLQEIEDFLLQEDDDRIIL